MAHTPRLRLWLLRHAQPQDVQGLCYGAREVSVTPADTRAAAQAFVQAWPSGSRPTIWVSQRQRAQDLAHALAHCFQETEAWGDHDVASPTVNVHTDARLNEFDFGDWEGTPWAQIPKAAFDLWTADFVHHRFGGRDSTGELLRRVQLALEDLWVNPSWPVASDAQSGAPTPQVVWVTHAGVIRAVNWLRRGEPIEALRAETWPVEAPGFGQWQVLDFP